MPIRIKIDDKIYEAEDGEILANVLLREKLTPFRTHPVDNSPRAPFCMMGVCFECLLEVDGKPSTQACLTVVKDGMIVDRKLT
jgi:D-hydroxyproline dehydrogenase subunit gamma